MFCPHCNKEINIDPYRTPAAKDPEPRRETPKKPKWYTKMDWYCPLDITPNENEITSKVKPDTSATVAASSTLWAYPAPIVPAPSASVPELLP